MKVSRSELKLRARQALAGNYGTLIGAVLILYGISYAFSGAMQIVLLGQNLASMTMMRAGNAIALLVVTFVVFYGIMLVFMQMLTVGFSKMYLNLCQSREVKVSQMFWAFRNHPGKFAVIAVAVFVFIVVWVSPIFVVTLAGAVSGETGFAISFFVIYEIVSMVILFWAALNWALFYYILADDPEKGILEALKESSRMMKGNRWRYMVLLFSFFGMELLGLLSFGIGLLWVTPYVSCTYAIFNDVLKPKTLSVVYDGMEFYEPSVEPAVTDPAE